MMQKRAAARERTGDDVVPAPAASDRFHAERARGDVGLSMGAKGIRRLRESGSLKIRLPSGSQDAILINTAGGIAGGDRYRIAIEAEPQSRIIVTSQAAERVYRTLGPQAEIEVRHRVEDGAGLYWLPQETILYDGSSLRREIEVDLAADARFLGLETTVLGRRESGETIQSLAFRENWTIRREGRLLHSERLRLEGALPRSSASLGEASAFSTLIFLAPEAEALGARCQPLLGETGGVSAWNGRLVLRLLAEDGYALRKRLATLLPLFLPKSTLPTLWHL